MDYLKMTIDYIEGRLSPHEYEVLLDHNDDLYQWIQNLVPPGKSIRIFNRELLISQEYPYDIRLVLKKYEALDEGGPKGSLSYHYFIHQHIASIVHTAFPNIPMIVDARPAMLRELGLFVCPNYIGGREVNESCILSNILGDIPTNWSTAKRNKEAKDRIKKAFHVEGNKYPRWIQSPEWPMNNGIPMRYVKTQTVNPEHVQHIFQDIRTGEQRIIDDFH